MKTAVETDFIRPRIAELKAQVGVLLDREGSGPDATGEELLKDLRAILKGTTPWGRLKRTGVNGLSPAARPACQRLLDNLRSGGFFVVEVGEMENFVPSVGKHGVKWLNAVLVLDLRNHPELETARQFAAQLASELGFPAVRRLIESHRSAESSGTDGSDYDCRDGLGS